MLNSTFLFDALEFDFFLRFDIEFETSLIKSETLVSVVQYDDLLVASSQVPVVPQYSDHLKAAPLGGPESVFGESRACLGDPLRSFRVSLSTA